MPQSLRQRRPQPPRAGARPAPRPRIQPIRRELPTQIKRPKIACSAFDNLEPPLKRQTAHSSLYQQRLLLHHRVPRDRL